MDNKDLRSDKPGALYHLTLSEKQARAVEQACELVARLGIGQFERISEMFLSMGNIDEYCRRRDDANDALKLAACIIFGRNHYNLPDVTNKNDWHNTTWDVYQVIRYTRSWHESPEGGWGVCFDPPMNTTGDPLPVCKIVEGEKNG